MTPERYARVKEIFLAACEQQEAQRLTWIEHATAGDAELCREVKSLLEHLSQGATGQSLTAISARTIPSSDAERFSPNTIISGRYRVLGRLGKGGMGEVYRADDLELEQPVALKFLSQELTADPRALMRFRDEVRLARRVTHRNVVRVHDLGEAAGEVFLSMEYVDGESLDALLRQIGRLPKEKSVETARQLCAGLGAAHDQGVLHRDLKTQNVMIDAAGRVRITDFGIAALASDGQAAQLLAGTPAYMAPELWNGAAPSVRTDLYSLGVVLYELATGQSPYPAETSRHHAALPPPVNPSVLVPEIDPALERAILQCIELSPARRPASAYEVMAMLPGTDLWTELIAAGGTPSPEMIAAAVEAPRPKSRARTLLIATLLGLGSILWQADQTLFLSQAAPRKPPAVLADRAEQIIQATGHALHGPKSWGFVFDAEFLEAAVSFGSTWAQQSLTPAIGFWYRQGQIHLPEPIPLGETRLIQPPAFQPGMIYVRTDTSGALREFLTVPATGVPDNTAADEPDWQTCFQLAGFDHSDFRPTAAREPPVYADRVAAWVSRTSDDSRPTIRVDAAGRDGRLVYFQTRMPWEVGNSEESEFIPMSPALSRTFAVRFWLYLGFLVTAVVLAWRNAFSGRGDRDGAARIGLFAAALAFAEWLVGTRHSPELGPEAMSLFLWLARATLIGSAMWVCYLAMEPYVRRYWPESIVTWSRILTGRWNDRQLRFDMLCGAAFGVTTVLLLQFDANLSVWLGHARFGAVLPQGGSHVDQLLGLRYIAGSAVNSLLQSISVGFLLLLAMLIFRVVLRHAWLSTVAYGLFLAGLFWFLDSYGFLPWLTGTLVAAGVVAILMRIGLTALIVGLFVRMLLLNCPLTRDWDAWYAPAGLCLAAFVAAIALWGASDTFRTGDWSRRR